MSKKVGFRVSFLLSFVFVVIAVVSLNAVAGVNQKPVIGSTSYYTANFFDYEQTERNGIGNFVVDGKEYDNDSKLILFNQEYYYVNPALYGVDSVPRPSEYNSWFSATRYKIVEGIVEDVLTSEGNVTLSNNRTAVSCQSSVTLFDKSDEQTYVGSYNFPFENIENGYLQYDSNLNHVNITDSVSTNGNYDMFKSKKGEVSKYGFMPFNELNLKGSKDEKGYYSLLGDANYYLGMTLDLPFYMPKDGKVTTSEGNEEDMIFKFSGDDDVWIFVDGKLVLDLGGIHDAVQGSINFATGKVTTTGNFYDEATGKYSTTKATQDKINNLIRSLSVGNHSLQVNFLERGGSISNCKITFRLKDEEPCVTETPSTVPPCTETPSTVPPCTETPSTVPPCTETPSTVPPCTETPSTEPPVVTEVPVVTVVPTEDPEEPVITEEPIVTETPVVTKDPVVTEIPVVTKAPLATETEKPVVIVNNDTPKGNLPQTGTIAEELFYILGALFVIGGFVLTFSKKKLNK